MTEGKMGGKGVWMWRVEMDRDRDEGRCKGMIVTSRSDRI